MMESTSHETKRGGGGVFVKCRTWMGVNAICFFSRRQMLLDYSMLMRKTMQYKSKKYSEFPFYRAKFYFYMVFPPAKMYDVQARSPVYPITFSPSPPSK